MARKKRASKKKTDLSVKGAIKKLRGRKRKLTKALKDSGAY